MTVNNGRRCFLDNQPLFFFYLTPEYMCGCRAVFVLIVLFQFSQGICFFSHDFFSFLLAQSSCDRYPKENESCHRPAKDCLDLSKADKGPTLHVSLMINITKVVLTNEKAIPKIATTQLLSQSHEFHELIQRSIQNVSEKKASTNNKICSLQGNFVSFFPSQKAVHTQKHTTIQLQNKMQS